MWHFLFNIYLLFLRALHLEFNEKHDTYYLLYTKYFEKLSFDKFNKNGINVFIKYTLMRT